MNIEFGEKHLESVAAHLNDAKTREASRTDNPNGTEEIEKPEAANSAVVLQISKNEDGTSTTDKLRTEQVEHVDEKKSQDKTKEVINPEGLQDMIAETQRKLLENFNI